MSRITFRMTSAGALLVDDYITIPRNGREILETKQEFYTTAKIPNIVSENKKSWAISFALYK